MKKLIGGLIIIGLLGLVGCATVVPSSNLTAPPSSSNPDIEQTLADRTWISPAMVQIGNYYPGARAEWAIRVHNGKDTPTEFLVSYGEPSYTKEGYKRAPTEVQDWIVIVDATPVLAPKETKEILVVLAMPKDISDASTLVWEITSDGLARFDTINRESYEKFLAEVKLSDWYIREKGYARTPEDLRILEAQAQEKAQVQLKQFISTDTEANLLSYFRQNTSVTADRFSKERPGDKVLLGGLSKQGFLNSWNLKEGKWEFWISVAEKSKEVVQTEMCSRWLVQMRQG